jgi:hypothetical protein
MLAEGLVSRSAQWGRPVPVEFSRAAVEVTTFEQAAAILADLDRQHAEGLI